MKRLILISVFVSGCTPQPELVKWHGDEYSICCGSCGEKDWALAIEKYCPAKSSKVVGGFVREQVVGSSSRKNIFGGYDRTIDTMHSECRIYQCGVDEAPLPTK